MTTRYLSSPEDPAFADVLRIYHASFDEASREPDERLAEELRREYRLPFRFLVVLIDDEVAGFARFCKLPDTDLGFLVHIAMDSEVRGQGMGSDLLRLVVEALAPSPVLVEIDREGRVRQWYERQGFVPVSETYTQPALHEHTPEVPYALFASRPVEDQVKTVLDFYRSAWERELPDPLVTLALGGTQ